MPGMVIVLMLEVWLSGMVIALGDLKDMGGVILFVDDILAYAATVPTMLDKLEQILSQLTAHGLKLKAKKCKFFQKEVPFLGNIVSREGIKVDSDRVKAIQDMPIPKTAKEL